ncbi:TPA: Ig-like domain-containing protein [Photobacterium damselae]
MRFLKRNIPLKLGLLGMVFNLLGCNGSNAPSVPEQQEQFVSASIIDDYSLIDIGDAQLRHKVKLLDKIKLSGNYEVIISSIESLSKNKACKIIEKDNEGFSIEGIDPLVCDYQYQIRLKSEDANIKLTGDTTGYTRVLMSNNPEAAKLIPFGVVAYENKPTIVDIEAELSKVGDATSLDDYVLNNDVVVTPSDSSSTISVDSNTHKITYESSDSSVRNEQVSYSFTNKSNGEVLAGSFVVTVADEIIHGIDIDENIEIGGADSAEVNVEKRIDISGYVNNVDDDYQLIYVSAFGAKVELSSSTDHKNKEFKFQADMIGDYYVNIIVSDHRGGYDVSLVKVNVIDPNGVGKWPSIWHGLLYFNAPLTVVDALTNGVATTSSYFDVDKGSWIATFDYNMAKAYCSTIGRLPTVTELKNLYTEKKPATLNWPIGQRYWSSDLSKLVDLSNGTESSSQPNTAYYVTCVGDGDFKIDAGESNVVDIIADGNDIATIVAKITFNGSPVAGEVVNLTHSSSATNNNGSQVATNDEGEAKFTLSSYKAETFKASVEYDSPRTRSLMKRSIDVSFIGDAKTANLDQSTTVDYVSIYDEKGEVTASLIDAYSNPVSKEAVSFSSVANNVSITPTTTETDANGKQVAKIEWIDPIPVNDQTVEVSSAYTLPGQSAPEIESSFVHFLVAIYAELRLLTNDDAMDGGTNFVQAILNDPSGHGKGGIDVEFKSSSNECLINNHDASTTPFTIKTDPDGHANAAITYAGPVNVPGVSNYSCIIEASYGGTTKSQVVNFISIYNYICGSNYNDKGDNANGNCVKAVAMDFPNDDPTAEPNIVTAAMSTRFWKTVKDKTDFNARVAAEGGDVVFRVDDSGGEFVKGGTKSDSNRGAALDIQCDAFSQLKVAGRDNWRGYLLVSRIYTKYGPMHANYNWPTAERYSKDQNEVTGGKLAFYSLEDGTKKYWNYTEGYFSCRSAGKPN